MERREKENEDELEIPAYNFEAIHNIDEYGVECVPTMREALKCWNMTVQFWLASTVYRRLPLSRPLRTAAVMVVSSMWHGVHSGYYLSLGSVPLVLMVEDIYDKVMRRHLSEQVLNKQYPYGFFEWQ